MTLYAVAVLVAIAVWSGVSIYAAIVRRRAFPVPPSPDVLPSVSLVVTALDEEQTIERAMRSMLALDYPNLELVAIDDRSSDRTGEILDALASQHSERMRVVHISELAPGWLGKCHALEHGARVATGEWILFTDADVLFDPSALRVAVAHAHARNADHVVLAPVLLWHGYVEASLLALFTMAIGIAFQTWRVESRSLRAFMGVGAFNLVRRSVYERFGGHETLRMEVADDMKLGYLVKKHGGRSTVVESEGLVQVRWREGALDVVRGLERSGFAGVDFRWSAIVASTLWFVGVMLAPYVLLVAGPSDARMLGAIAIAVLIVAYAVVARVGRMPLWIGVLHPVACALFSWSFLRSAFVTTREGGVRWRGTLYSIQELRRGTVR